MTRPSGKTMKASPAQKAMMAAPSVWVAPWDRTLKALLRRRWVYVAERLSDGTRPRVRFELLAAGQEALLR